MYFTLLSRHTDNFIQAKNNNNNNNNQGHTCDRAGRSVLRSVCPQPTLSRYYVNRDTLFCYHKASEAFLQRLMALYVASHYKVTLFHTLNNSIFLKRAQCPTHSVISPRFVHLLTRCFLGFQNSPNDLQMLSDAPAHHLFCLLPPVPPTQNSLPEVLAVVQVRRDEILLCVILCKCVPTTS